MDHIDIVIVTWNSASTIRECLDSLHLSSHVERRVHVVDNASSDATMSIVRHYERQGLIRVTANSRNHGLAAANNHGITSGDASTVVIANPDVVFGEECVDSLVSTLGRHHRAAFAVAKLSRPDGSLQTSVGDMPSLGEALLGRASRLRTRSATRIWWTDWPHDVEREVGHGQEACYAVRRSAIVEVGLQDPRYRLDWEGYDWTRRMTDRGWQVWFSPAAQALHVGGVSLRSAPYRWVCSSHRGLYLFFSRSISPALRPLLAVAVASRAAVKCVFVAVSRDATAVHP